MKNIVILIMLCFSLSLNAAPDYLEDGKGTSDKRLCPNANIFGSKLISGICWSCMLPFAIMGVGSPDHEPEGASDSYLCGCQTSTGIPDVGFRMSFWNPVKLVEVVRQPYCSPVLGGTAFGFDPTAFGGYGMDYEDSIGSGFYHVNYWAFPLMSIMELLLNYRCYADYFTEMDLINTSTIDPIINDPELAFFMVPEVVIFSNPVSQAACAVDCSITTSTGKSSDAFFWCAGCWGSMYPLTTWNHSEESPPRDSNLVAARYIALQHRRGFARKSFGDDEMCGATIWPFFPKEQYRWSMMFPIAEAGTGDSNINDQNSKTIDNTLNGECCHATGESPFIWGEWRNIPVLGEDFVYMLWTYTDCCA